MRKKGLRHGQGGRKKPSLPVRPLSVVCVGASAGGLEALSRFFGRLRPDLAMAYIVILHLAPDHESNLPEILQRNTPMPVMVAQSGQSVLANHIYVIPPNAALEIEDGKLMVSTREAATGKFLPIDGFLRTLAKDQQRRAIAVILSGSGHDGTLGAKAVKDEGGLVFAQDAASAGQRSMPQSAIDTGRSLARGHRRGAGARGAPPLPHPRPAHRAGPADRRPQPAQDLLPGAQRHGHRLFPV